MYYVWQEEVLRIPGVLEGTKNAFVVAPTSAGKSRVADAIIARRLRDDPIRKVLVVLPYVALCAETADRLRDMKLHPRAVCEAFGSKHSITALGGVSRVIVTTIESAVTIVTKAIQLNGSPDAVFSLAIIDECHMIYDETRGHALETLLLLLRARPSTQRRLQLACFTAHVPYAPSLAQWLDAVLYETTFRPVPLIHHVVLPDKTVERYSEDDSSFVGSGTTSLDVLVSSAGGPVLVFCASKREAEFTARELGRRMPPNNDPIENGTRTGIDELDILLHVGCAYHHADVPQEARTIVEDRFRSRQIRVLCCTPTLAAGVNLPVRRVVIKHPYVGKDVPLTSITYHQMAGRAGRAGLDRIGEAFVFAPRGKEETVRALIRRADDIVPSSRLDIAAALLSCIVAGTVRTPNDVTTFMRTTLHSYDGSFICETLASLGSENLVVWDDGGGEYLPTPLGRAIGRSGLQLCDARSIVDTLQRIRRRFVMTSDIQLALLASQLCPRPHIEWHQISAVLRGLSPDDREALEAMGISVERMVTQAYAQRTNIPAMIEAVPLAVELCHAVSGTGGSGAETVCDHAARVLGKARDVCYVMAWTELSAACDAFRARLALKSSGDTVAFGGIPSLTAAMATKLRGAGIETVHELAQASASVIRRVLGDRGHQAQLDARVAVVTSGQDALDAAADVCVANTVRVAVAWTGRRDRLDRRVVRGILVDDLVVALDTARDRIAEKLGEGRSIQCLDWKDVLVAAPALCEFTPRVTTASSWSPIVAGVLAGMERRGMALTDRTAIERHRQEMTGVLCDAQWQAETFVPCVDISCPYSVAHALYDVLKLRTDGSHGRSTNKKALDLLPPHPLISAVRSYRTAKEVMDALDGLLQYADITTGIVQTVFTPTTSGRITTETFNLQCLPRELRRYLRAPTPGYQLLLADYSHIELRILAAACGDVQLQGMLSSREADPFGELALQLGVSRTMAKSVFYAMVYGSSEERAMNLRSSFHTRFPTASDWIARTVQRAERTGTVEDLFGRVHEVDRDRAVTVAVNTVCQTSCATVLHRALEALDDAMPGTLLLCIHDEAVLQVCPTLAAMGVSLARATMESVAMEAMRGVPLFVEIHAASTWGG